MKLNFGISPVQSRSKRKSAGACINFIHEKSGEDYILFLAPGLTRKAIVDTGLGRGCKAFGGKLYVVNHDGFYELDTNYTATKKGGLYTSGGRVSMSFDGTYIVIVDGTKVYTYNVDTGVFAPQTDTDIFSNPTTTVFSDGFHYINDPATGQMMTHETAYDPSGNWSALDYATAEYSPDQLLTMVADHAIVYMFGEESTEPWEYDANSQALPLRPIRAGYMEYGTVAAQSPVQFDNSIAWLAKDRNGHGYAVRAEGWTPKIISTPELHKEWSTYSTLSDAFSMVWSLQGIFLWVLVFPTADKSWCYNSTTGTWVELRRYDEDPSKRGRVRLNDSTFFNGKVVGIDYFNGNLYEIDFDTYTENSEPIIAIAESQKVWDAGRRIRHGRIELFFERNVALLDTSVAEIETTLSASYVADDTTLVFADDLLTSVATTIQSNYTGGETQVVVLSDVGISAGNDVAIVMDDATIHTTTISGQPASNTFNITDALPSACSVGNAFTAFDSSTVVDLEIGITLDDGTVHWTTVDSMVDDDSVVIARGLESAATSGNRVLFYDPDTVHPTQGSDPEVRLQYSDDDGLTWIDKDWKSIGKRGELKSRVFYDRMGSSRERIYRVEVSDPVGWILAGAELYAK